MKRTWDLALLVLLATFIVAALYEVQGVVGEWLDEPGQSAAAAPSKPEPPTTVATAQTDSPQKPKVILPPKDGFQGGPTVQNPNAPITPEQQKYLDDLLRQGEGKL
jgi:hypothetical protein